MEVKRKNRKEDLKLLVSLGSDYDGESFSLKFTSGNYGVTSYTCSYDGTTYTNCEKVDDTHVLCLLDNHNLPYGLVYVEITICMPDTQMADGNYKLNSRELLEFIVDSKACHLELTNGASDMVETAEITFDLLAPVLKGDKGEKGEKGDKGDPGIDTVDTEMSDESENPVQNKVIKSYVDDGLADKADAKKRVVIYLNSDNTIAGIGGDDIKYDGTCEFFCNYMGQATTLSFPLTYYAGGYRENPCLKGLFFMVNTATLYKVVINDVTEGASASVTQITTQEELNALQEEIATKQDKLIAGANITIADDGKTISATGGGGSVTTDTAMSDTSTNPVQNKVIKSYVDSKSVTLEVQNVTGSENTYTGTLTKSATEIVTLINAGNIVSIKCTLAEGMVLFGEVVLTIDGGLVCDFGTVQVPPSSFMNFSGYVSDNNITIFSVDVAKKSSVDEKLDSSAIADWAKASTKPNYEASEIGAEGYDNVQSAIASLMTDINKKADTSTTYTKTQVDTKLGNLEFEVVCSSSTTDGDLVKYTTDKTATEVFNVLSAGGKVHYKVYSKEGSIYYTANLFAKGLIVASSAEYKDSNNVLIFTAYHTGSEFVTYTSYIAEKKHLAKAYDSTSTYAVGDYCLENTILYKCNTAIDTPEEFNSKHWDKIDSVLSEVSSKANESEITELSLKVDSIESEIGDINTILTSI